MEDDVDVQRGVVGEGEMQCGVSLGLDLVFAASSQLLQLLKLLQVYRVELIEEVFLLHHNEAFSLFLLLVTLLSRLTNLGCCVEVFPIDRPRVVQHA